MIYNYPKLSRYDFGIFRVSGPGLANCLFFVAQAFVASLNNGGKVISPTWAKFSIGPYLRREKDKRGYINLFSSFGVTGFKKILILLGYHLGLKSSVQTYDGLNDYFVSLRPYQEDIKALFDKTVNPEAISTLAGTDFSNTVAVHVRLGDYPQDRRVPILWYKAMMERIQQYNPEVKFALFSDGTDEELKPLTDMSATEKMFFGNAIADIYAISRCKIVLASDSTFSAWGSFLGDSILIFNKRHFPAVYDDSDKEYVIQDAKNVFPQKLINHISLLK